MITDVLNAVAIAIASEFGDTYTIYTDEVKQGLQEPCFFISVLQPSREQVVGNRYLMRVPLNITLLLEDIDRATKYSEATERLFDALEYIAAGPDIIRGVKMRSEIAEGALHFFVEYGAHVSKQTDPVDKMGAVSLTQTLEG